MADLDSLNALLEHAASASGPDCNLDSAISGTLLDGDHYTSSVDMALRLAVVTLPGWHWHAQSVGVPYTLYEAYGSLNGQYEDVTLSQATSPALAVLLAVLRALVAIA